MSNITGRIFIRPYVIICNEEFNQRILNSANQKTTSISVGYSKD